VGDQRRILGRYFLIVAQPPPPHQCRTSLRCPSERNLYDAPRAKAAAQGFLDHRTKQAAELGHPPLIILFDHGPPYLEFVFGWRSTPTGGQDDPLADAAEEAARLFTLLLASDWCNTLAKCRRKDCQRYYQLTKPRDLYKRGTYCRRCNSAASAERITAENRRIRKERFLFLAVAALEEWQEKNEHQQTEYGQWKEYVTNYVNRRTRDAKITSKWVTRNLRRIESVRQERTDRGTR
jgi:hypothetical protein